MSNLLKTLPDKFRKLSFKERAFAEYFLICRNKAEAAKLAGIESKAANKSGYWLFNKPLVQDYIEYLLESMKKEFAITRQEQIAELVEMRSNLKDKRDIGSLNLLLKVNDQINKLLGVYETEKIKMEVDFHVDFGNALASIGTDINGDIIDAIDFEEVDRMRDSKDGDVDDAEYEKLD